MVPTTKNELRKLVTDTTVDMYEELTPELVRLINETKKARKHIYSSLYHLYSISMI